MKNTICEKLMWSAMTPAVFKFYEKSSADLSYRRDYLAISL